MTISEEPKKSHKVPLCEILEEPLWEAPESMEKPVLARMERMVRQERRRRMLIFSNWPPIAQAAFVLVSVGIAAVSLGAAGRIAELLSRIGPVSHVVAPQWTIAGVIAVLALYTAFTKLSVDSYRTLKQ